jgi:hypothetical protein
MSFHCYSGKLKFSLRPPNFRIEIPGDDILKSRILEKIQQVKNCLTSKYNKPVNNGIIIEDLLDFWKE